MGEKVLLTKLFNMLKSWRILFADGDLGHSGSSPPMSAAQDGATGRPPWSNLGELTFMDVAGEQVKFGSVSWDSVLHQCSTGDR